MSKPRPSLLPDLLDESDSEERLLVEHESHSLRIEAEKLRRENAVLRAQFEQSVAVSNRLTEMHHKNSALSATVRSLQQEKTDLLRRLDMAVRTNDELNSRLSDERHASAVQHDSEVAFCDQERMAFRKRYQEKVGLFELQLKTAEESTEKVRTAYRVLESKVGQLTKAASLYFGKTFTDLDIVTEFLKQPQVGAVQESTGQRVEVLEVELERAFAKLKQQRRRLKESRKESAALSRQVSELKLQIAELEGGQGIPSAGTAECLNRRTYSRPLGNSSGRRSTSISPEDH
jgi:hypothetical protein